MTTQTQEIIEAVAPISDKLLQYMTATEELLSKYGGDVADLALTVLRVEAAGQLLIGAIATLCLVVAYKFFPKKHKDSYYTVERVTKLIQKRFISRSSREDSIVKLATGYSQTNNVPTDLTERMKNIEFPAISWENPQTLITGFICGATAFISAIVMMNTLFVIWNWVGLFWPEAYAVHKFILS